jgi:hypothetical protein
MSAAFQTYVDYVFLKRHFSDEKFIWSETANYKRMKLESFLKRRDVSFFNALYSAYKIRRPIVDHLISCFLYDSDFWIGNALKDEYIMRHQNRMMRFGALERTFLDDGEKIEEYLKDHELRMDALVLTSGIKSPIIMELYPATISLETLAVLEHLTGFIGSWFPINPLQKWRRLIIHKYSYLLRFEERNVDKIQSVYQNLVQL